MSYCQDLKDIIDKINEITNIIERRNKIREMLEAILAIVWSIIPGFPHPGDMADEALDLWWVNLQTQVQSACNEDPPEG